MGGWEDEAGGWERQAASPSVSVVTPDYDGHLGLGFIVRPWTTGLAMPDAYSGRVIIWGDVSPRVVIVT